MIDLTSPQSQARQHAVMTIFDHVFLEATNNTIKQHRLSTMKDYILGQSSWSQDIINAYYHLTELIQKQDNPCP